MGDLNVERVREFAELQARKAELNEEIDAINERCGELKPKILEEFEREGVPRLPIAGLGTVHLHRTGWARVVAAGGGKPTKQDKAAAREALRACGMGEFVQESYNTQTVSAWMREMAREGEDLPPELDGKLRYEEEFDVRFRRT